MVPRILGNLNSRKAQCDPSFHFMFHVSFPIDSHLLGAPLTLGNPKPHKSVFYPQMLLENPTPHFGKPLIRQIPFLSQKYPYTTLNPTSWT